VTVSRKSQASSASAWERRKPAHVLQSRSGTCAYDATGNTTKRAIGTTTQNLTWDIEGRLANVVDSSKGTTGYLYTPGGDRLLRRDPGGTTLYLPGTELRQAKGSSTATATRYYSHGDHTRHGDIR
jgi:hypothetical protein